MFCSDPSLLCRWSRSWRPRWSCSMSWQVTYLLTWMGTSTSTSYQVRRESSSQRRAGERVRGDWLSLPRLPVWAINLTLRYLLYNCSVNVPTWALGRQSCPRPKLAAWWPGSSHSSTRGLIAQMAQVIPFPPRTDNSPQRPNSMLPPTLKEADQGQQQTGQFKLECLSLQKLLAPSGATRTPSCQLCFCTNLCRPQHALQRWASIFSPCFANKVTVVRKWKTEWAKKIWISPLQYSSASDDIAFGNLPSQQIWLCRDLMKNLFLTVQSPLVHLKTRVTNLEGGCWTKCSVLEGRQGTL